MITEIPVSSITVLPGRRRLDPQWVETLSDMLSSQGQLSPIEVIADGDDFRLVFGHHRLAAAKLLGWSDIDAIVKDAKTFTSEAEITLREIAENLARRELSVLDRSVDIARWREVYEATHLVNTKGGRPRKLDPEETSLKFETSFSDAARKVLDISRPSLFRTLKISSIDTDVRERIALHAIADNQSELLALATEPPHRQKQIADLLVGEPAQATVAGAIAIIDGQRPKAKAEGWEKLSRAFSGLKPKDQDRFFELHEAAIARWLRGRNS